jgi:hypothetical protein
MTPGVIAPEGAFVLVGSKPRAAWPVTLPPPAAAYPPNHFASQAPVASSACGASATGVSRTQRAATIAAIRPNTASA